jgi:hypothetical protein
MKQFLPLLLMLSFSATAQKLTTNETDEFTRNQVKETSVEKLAHPFKMSGFAYNFSAKRINDNYYFNLRMMSLNKEVFAIRKDSKLMIRLKNDSIITLLAPSFEVSGTGKAGSGLSAGSAEGTSVYYPISRDEIDLLLSSEIVKLRVYTSEGYTEQDIKEAGSKKVKECFRLVL